MVQEPRARFHVVEWGGFCHSAWLQISPARFKKIYSDSAIETSTYARTASKHTTLPASEFRIGGISRLHCSVAMGQRG